MIVKTSNFNYKPNASTTILTLESSGNICTIALCLPDGTIDQLLTDKMRRHTEFMLPMIDQLLVKHQVLPSDLTLLAFGAGPGNYTGLRLSASMVQGLAYGWDKPVLPVSTLGCMAWAEGKKHDVSHIAVALDARKQQVSYGCYRLDLSDNCTNSPYEILTAETITSPDCITLPSKTNHWLLLGDAWQHASLVDQLGIHSKQLTIQTNVYPDAKMIAQLALKLYQANADLFGAEQAIPKYYRDSV